MTIDNPEPGRILIFHEDPRVIEEMVRVLPLYDISVAYRSDEAVRMLENRAYDLVILNGTATNRIWNSVATRCTPALVLTSETDPAGLYPNRTVPRLSMKDLSRLPLVLAQMLSGPTAAETNTRPRWLGRTPLFAENDSLGGKGGGFWHTYRFIRSRYLE